METKVKELLSTHITAAPEVLFEIMCQLEEDEFLFNHQTSKPKWLEKYSIQPFSVNGVYYITIGSWDAPPPSEIMQKISQDMDCEIHVVFYDEEYTKTIRDVTYKSGEAIEAIEV